MKFLFIPMLLLATGIFARDTKPKNFKYHYLPEIALNTPFENIVNRQNSTPDSNYCSCIKPLFDYLLHSSRLDILETDNITLQSLITDAANAGFFVNSNHCSMVAGNLNSLFYTTTPHFVKYPGYIVAPEGEAYKAKIGNYLLRFRPVQGRFENKLSDFFPKNCTPDGKVAYAGIPVSTECNAYTIIHDGGNKSMSWYVHYADCDGNSQVKWFRPGDNTYSFCGSHIYSIQDADTAALVYAASWYSLSSVVSATCTIDPANYYRATIAVVEIEAPPANARQNRLQVRAFPNPTPTGFNVAIQTSNQFPIFIYIIDMEGRIVETIPSVQGKQTISIGNQLRKGIYFAEIRQGNERERIKLIKQ